VNEISKNADEAQNFVDFKNKVLKTVEKYEEQYNESIKREFYNGLVYFARKYLANISGKVVRISYIVSAYIAMLHVHEAPVLDIPERVLISKLYDFLEAEGYEVYGRNTGSHLRVKGAKEPRMQIVKIAAQT